MNPDTYGVEYMPKKCWMCGPLTLAIAGLLSGAAFAQGRPAGDLPGPIDSIGDLRDTAKIIFKLADTNNDGQISQKEAVDVGNLLVGGFFFRADQNGDGVLERQEAVAAREQLLRQQPWLRFVFSRAAPGGAGGTTAAPGQSPGLGQANRTGGAPLGGNPIRTVANLLDSNHDQRIQASELRQAVQSSVQMLFAVADSNQDGQMSPAELNQAVEQAARSMAQAAFQSADADRNGGLSQAEFDRALTEPAHAFFRVLDLNNDNQLSLEEIQRAQQFISQQIERGRIRNAGNAAPSSAAPPGIVVQPTQFVAPAPATTVAPVQPGTPQP